MAVMGIIIGEGYISDKENTASAAAAIGVDYNLIKRVNSGIRKELDECISFGQISRSVSFYFGALIKCAYVIYGYVHKYRAYTAEEELRSNARNLIEVALKALHIDFENGRPFRLPEDSGNEDMERLLKYFNAGIQEMRLAFRDFGGSLEDLGEGGDSPLEEGLSRLEKFFFLDFFEGREKNVAECEAIMSYLEPVVGELKWITLARTEPELTR